MGAATPEHAVDVVRRFYEFMSEGRSADAVALIDDDFVLHEPRGLPFGGEYHGPEGFKASWARIMDFVEPELAGPVRFLDTGNPAVALLRGRFTSPSGKVAETDIVELFSVRDGRIVELDVYYKDPSGVAALS